MGDGKWWMNRIGQFAPTSNPGSQVPDYGLTLDVGTAPWDQPADFNALVNARVNSAFSFLQGMSQRVAHPVEFRPSGFGMGNVGGATTWDALMGTKDAITAPLSEGAKAAVGTIDAVANKFGGDATLGDQYGKLSKHADKMGLKGWDRLTYIGGADLAAAGKKATEDPIASKVFWALDKASEYGATGFVSATEAQQHGGMFWDPANLRRANAFVQKNDLSAGEGFVQMFWDDEILDDEKRLADIRKHNTVFNFGALTFNAVAAWKYAPEVLGAKAAGGVRNMRAGMIDKSGSANSVIQRTVLGAKTRSEAEAIARNAGGIANRVRAQRALTLWDKSQNLRTAALDMGHEDFRRLAPFQNSASGAVLSKLLQDVAHDDNAWNLVFRASIGDSSAVEPLRALRQDVADKIGAIELDRLPTLESDFNAVADRYEARLREQGGSLKNDDRLILTSARDWFLDEDFNIAKARLDEAKAELGGYQEYDSWVARATESMKVGGDTKVNTIFNTLDTLQPAKAGREAIGDLGNSVLYGARRGIVNTFRVDEYGRMARLITAPAKPMLKRTSMVDLTYAESGADAVAARLDQIGYFAGKRDPKLRDAVLGRWGAARSDMERKQIAFDLDRQGMDVVFRKHGIDNARVREEIINEISKKRGMSYAKLSDSSLYTTVKDANGKRLDKRVFETVDDKGTKVAIAMPMDPTELPNFHPFVNLTDLDRAIARSKTRLQELNREANLLERTGRTAGRHTQRLLSDLYNEVGESFNSFWKPWALLSLRWPTRVVADETMRVMLFLGAGIHMQSAMKGTKNVLLNTGFVKPIEYLRGRKVTTGSLAEDSLRTMNEPWDPFDPRAAKNPTGAVPFDVAELGKADAVRQDRLLAQAAEQRDWLRKGQMAARPRWAQRFEDRVAALNDGDSRGFFFDPVNGRARNKGFAVSVYPGRLRTYTKKPSAAELHWWMENNTDLLSIPSNQVAVWADRGTGRWHIDVVRATKRREDAMQLAARAQASEFYDITDGFTRYMRDEDPQGHAAFAAEANAPQAQPEMPDAPLPEPSTKRKIGVGKVKWKTADGKFYEGDDIYGPDVDNLNVFAGLHSAKGMAHKLYGGYAKGLGDARMSRNSRAATTIHPADATDIEGNRAWVTAQSEYVNKHFRRSPIWRRMLDGQTDEQIEKWLTSTADGRDLRARMGKRAMHPGQWVDDMRMIFDHTLPTPQARLAARAGDVTPEQWDELIPHEYRNTIHGDDIRLTEGSDPAQKFLRRQVNRLMDVLGAMPTDEFVRHPFAANLYNQRMRNYIRSLDSDELTPEVQAAAHASARAYATKEVNRLLYNMADEVEAMHMLRFAAPFIQAQIEVLERYAGLFARKPEAAVRFAELFLLSQQNNPDKGLWHTVDADGNPTSKFSHDNKVVLQDNALTRSLKKITGLKGTGDFRIPVASLDLVFQGDNPLMPSMGPLVTYPANELYYRDNPLGSEGFVFKWLYPYGTPKGDNPATRAFNSMAPAYVKRLWTALTNDFNDSAYANWTDMRYRDLVFAYRKEHGTNPNTRQENMLVKQAQQDARHYWFLRGASSLLLPFPVEAGSPQQFWIDQARKYRNKYGLDADRKFYDDYPEYFIYFTSSSQSNNGLAPTIAGAEGYLKNKKWADIAPDLAGILAGPQAGKGDFSYEVYNWQFRTPVKPGSKQKMRELVDPDERVKENQVAQGWIEYSKLSAATDAEMRARGLTSLNSNAAADLARWRFQEMQGIIERNPAWQEAYRSRHDTLSSWLAQANAVVTAPGFEKLAKGRPDLHGLANYLVSREKVQALLFQRYMNGGSKSLGSQNEQTGEFSGENADLAGAWNSYITELTAKNPLFAEIYHRYLESDDLTVVVND